MYIIIFEPPTSFLLLYEIFQDEYELGMILDECILLLSEVGYSSEKVIH